MWTLLTIPRCWYKVWNLWRIDSGDQNKYQIYKNITIIIIIKLLSYFNHKQLKLAPDNSISLSKLKLLINSINKLRSSLYINVFGLKNRSNTLYLSSNRDRCSSYTIREFNPTRFNYFTYPEDLGSWTMENVSR